jgi:hypothetical protein
MEFDKIVVNVLDDTAQVSDLKVEVCDDVVYICQDNTMVQITLQMWDELILAMNSSAGSFIKR